MSGTYLLPRSDNLGLLFGSTRSEVLVLVFSTLLRGFLVVTNVYVLIWMKVL